MYNNFMSILTLYHGSSHTIDKPIYGYGKIHNDYGLGFYLTEDLELAKEWSVTNPSTVGFVNVYKFDDADLSVLELVDEHVLVWLTILLRNRTFTAKGELARSAIKYLADNFLIDYEKYDVIHGWRADDSYFAYASDFVNGAISLRKLDEAIHLGNLGMQYALKSRLAFDRVGFDRSLKVAPDEYWNKRYDRDRKARDTYLSGDKFSFSKDDIFITDILREEMKRDDPRLQ